MLFIIRTSADIYRALFLHSEISVFDYEKLMKLYSKGGNKSCYIEGRGKVFVELAYLQKLEHARGYVPVL